MYINIRECIILFLDKNILDGNNINNVLILSCQSKGRFFMKSKVYFVNLRARNGSSEYELIEI